MNTRGLVLLGLGVVLMLIGLTADWIGISAEPDFFGWKQFSLIAVGAAATCWGVVLLRNPGADDD